MTKNRIGLTDRTSRKLPHQRLKPAHQPQRQPNKISPNFPDGNLSSASRTADE